MTVSIESHFPDGTSYVVRGGSIARRREGERDLRCAGLILAAGRASRFGGGKVGASLRGTPLVRHVADRLLRARLAPIVVVTDGDETVRDALAGTEAQLVVNHRPDEGMSTSLRVGVEALTSNRAGKGGGPASAPETRPDAVVVALGDQPYIDPHLVTFLVDTWRRYAADAVVPRYSDGRGNPVLFDAALFPSLRALTGDRGARDLLAALGDRVAEVDVSVPAPRDVDTRDDLQLLEASAEGDSGRGRHA